MNFGLNYAVLIATTLLLGGCIIVSNPQRVMVMQKATPADTRSNDQIEQLLPVDAFQQNEFPKPYMLTMMRVCINKNNVKNDNNPIYVAGKTDQFCSCVTDKRVHTLTMSEFMEVDKGGPQADPQAMHKNNEILAKCAQTILKQ